MHCGELSFMTEVWLRRLDDIMGWICMWSEEVVMVTRKTMSSKRLTVEWGAFWPGGRVSWLALSSELSACLRLEESLLLQSSCHNNTTQETYCEHTRQKSYTSTIVWGDARVRAVRMWPRHNHFIYWGVFGASHSNYLTQKQKDKERKKVSFIQADTVQLNQSWHQAGNWRVPLRNHKRPLLILYCPSILSQDHQTNTGYSAPYFTNPSNSLWTGSKKNYIEQVPLEMLIIYLMMYIIIIYLKQWSEWVFSMIGCFTATY